MGGTKGWMPSSRQPSPKSGWVAQQGEGAGTPVQSHAVQRAQGQARKRCPSVWGPGHSRDCWEGQGWWDESWNLLCFVCVWKVHPPVELLSVTMVWELRQLWTLL